MCSQLVIILAHISCNNNNCTHPVIIVMFMKYAFIEIAEHVRSYEGNIKTIIGKRIRNLDR